MNNMPKQAAKVEPPIFPTTNNFTVAGAWLVRRHHVPYNIANYVAAAGGLPRGGPL
jgi:hypothetical protein